MGRVCIERETEHESAAKTHNSDAASNAGKHDDVADCMACALGKTSVEGNAACTAVPCATGKTSVAGSATCGARRFLKAI